MRADDLAERDTQTGIWKSRSLGNLIRKISVKGQRDLIRKVALGTNFVVIGIENQDKVHYLMPMRVMRYDLSEYYIPVQP